MPGGESDMAIAERAKDLLRTRGRIPVFPLPDLVFFPHTELPLHVFEPRYRAMTEDVLSGDRLIAMALLKPGWEGNYDGSPQVHPIACAGLVEDEIRLPDGRYNIRLRGLSRVEILEFVQDRPYRIASVRVLPDLNEEGGPNAEEEKRNLVRSCSSLLQEMSGQPGPAFTVDGEVPLASLVNSLCQSLALDSETKQVLLDMGDVVLRGRALVSILNERWRSIALHEAGRRTTPEGGVH